MAIQTIASPGSVPCQCCVLCRWWCQELCLASDDRPLPAPQVQLERELEQLSRQLDKDMKAMEARRQPGKVGAPCAW